MQTEVEKNAQDRTMTPRFSRTRRGILLLVLPALALAGVGGWVSSARAGGPDGDEAGPGPMRRMHRILDRVGATQGQRDQIRAIWTGLRPQLRAVRADQKSLRQQMVAALTAPSINAGDVERLRKQTMANADKMSGLITQGIVASAQVLTPDQRKLAQQEIANGAGRHHHWGPDAP
jgi:Spy/CpxP family protein refolding chaperone